jgi:arabinosaccharide transport system substrate-binding protein
MICPDWVLATMRSDAQAYLAGVVQCMPLPAWSPGGRRTSTSGGTMMGIPKGCPDVDRAWEMAQLLYCDRESLVQRFRDQTIVPPLKSVYDDPVFDEPQPFFMNQPVGRLLTELALQVPPVNGSPYASEAFALLNGSFTDAMKQRITPEVFLGSVAQHLREMIERDRAAITQASGNGPA